MSSAVNPLSVSDTLPTYREVEERARERLGPAGWDFLEGGASGELTVRANSAAFQGWVFRPRLMTGVSDPDTSTSVLGQRLAMPVLTAPFGADGLFHADGHLAVARAAARMGAMMTAPVLGTYSLDQIAEISGPKLFQLHASGDLEEAREMAQRAASAGYAGVCITMDTPVSTWRERQMRRPHRPARELVSGNIRMGENGQARGVASKVVGGKAEPWTWDNLAAFCKAVPLPVAGKGILTGADARRATECGVSAVWVSNHGGRALDCVPATLDQLEEVVGAVGGRAEVLLDGGVRRGSDVVKALALGARAVALGRAVAAGLAAAGEDGVGRVLELIHGEMRVVMGLLGVGAIQNIDRTLVAEDRGFLRPS